MTRIWELIASTFLLVMLTSLSIGANAADIRPIIHGGGSYREIVIEGIIESGDFEKFIEIIRDNQGRISTVWIFSPGGDFDEAMKIGRGMRALELASISGPERDSAGRLSCDGMFGFPEPKDPRNCTCASACFFIHIGGVSRGGKFLAVHRPYFEKGRFGELTEEGAKKEFDALQNRARAYMFEMGVPKHIQEDVLGTPSERALILDEKTVETYFFGGLPYRHEWVKNKCSRLSDEETRRKENYSSRIVSARNTIDAVLSRAELEDLAALQKKQKEERDCAGPINEQRRAAAYEKYFRVKPSDYAHHNFSKWSEASKYLGRSLDDILNEEKFEDDKSQTYGAGGRYLVRVISRAATANAPMIHLHDSHWKKRVVTSVSLTSPPNPSPEFTQRLVKSLDDAWGKQSGGNGTTEWLWDKKEFSARLVKEPKAADGAFVSLRISEK